MTETPAPIEDRDANIRATVDRILVRGHEAMYEQLDALHKRNIHDDDVMKALRALGFENVAEGYLDWADIDERTDDNTTMNPAVPDPGSAASYLEWTGQGTTIHLKNGEPRVTSAPAKVEVVWP